MASSPASMAVTFLTPQGQCEPEYGARRHRPTTTRVTCAGAFGRHTCSGWARCSWHSPSGSRSARTGIRSVGRRGQSVWTRWAPSRLAPASVLTTRLRRGNCRATTRCAGGRQPPRRCVSRSPRKERALWVVLVIPDRRGRGSNGRVVSTPRAGPPENRRYREGGCPRLPMRNRVLEGAHTI